MRDAWQADFVNKPEPVYTGLTLTPLSDDRADVLGCQLFEDHCIGAVISEKRAFSLSIQDWLMTDDRNAISEPVDCSRSGWLCRWAGVKPGEAGVHCLGTGLCQRGLLVIVSRVGQYHRLEVQGAVKNESSFSSNTSTMGIFIDSERRQK